MTHLLAVGTAVPATCLEPEDAAKVLAFASKQPSRYTRKLVAQTDIATRYSVLEKPYEFYKDEHPSTATRMHQYDIEAPKLAAQAVESLLKGRVDLARTTQLITVSCTGFSAPGIDATLVQKLDLPRNIERVHVGFMGCGAMFNALRLARDHCSSGTGRQSLIVSVELCSLHLTNDSEIERYLGNYLFGDAAAALLIGEQGVGLCSLDASLSQLDLASTEAIRWHIGDAGFDMFLDRKLPDRIQRLVEQHITTWLEQCSICSSDVQTWLLHPGGVGVLRALRHALKLPEDAVHIGTAVLNKYGNLSSASLGFLLAEAKPMQLPAVAIGFGPGLSLEAQLLL